MGRPLTEFCETLDDVLALAVKNANGPTIDDDYVRTLIRLLK
jgi:hypothetical protein